MHARMIVQSTIHLLEREDLGALFARITARLIDAERPLLSARGLSMWQYIVLSELSRRPAKTQLSLAEAIGYDKTRLIALLDDLEHRDCSCASPTPLTAARVPCS